MNWTNALGTITAILGVILAAMTQLLGCTIGADGVTPVCSSTILPPAWMVWAAMIFGVLTIASKLIRPGGPIRSLFGPTAVVVPEAKSGPGVVTKAQVASK